MSGKIMLEALVNIWKIKKYSGAETSFGQFFKFAITGGLGTITNLAVFFVFADLLGLPEIPVSVVCFIIAVTQNYILNHLWSFKTHTAGTGLSLKQWGLFTASSLLGLAVNIIVMKLILLYRALPYKFIAQAWGIAAGMIINFFLSKYAVFKKGKINGKNI